MSQALTSQLQEVRQFCTQYNIPVRDNQNPWVALLQSNNIQFFETALGKLSTDWGNHTLADLDYPQSEEGVVITEDTANGFYGVMLALYNAAENGLSIKTKAVANVISALSKNTPDETVLTGLSQKITSGNWQGTTPWSIIFLALDHVITQKNSAIIGNIVATTKALIDRLNVLTPAAATAIPVQEKPAGDWYCIVAAFAVIAPEGGKEALKNAGLSKNIRNQLAEFVITEAQQSGKTHDEKIDWLQTVTNKETFLGKMLNVDFGLTASSDARKSIDDAILKIQNAKRAEEKEAKRAAAEGAKRAEVAGQGGSGVLHSLFNPFDAPVAKSRSDRGNPRFNGSIQDDEEDGNPAGPNNK